jgi:hypothetical protein
MISEKASVKGSGKKSKNWIPLDSCDIYYDHSTYLIGALDTSPPPYS